MSKEQQREARRQKVLARSQAGHPSPVVDLATQKQDVVGASAELDVNEPEAPSLDDGTGSALNAAGESGKSAAKLAAERRRQRILSKSIERMAKVQGDRLSGGTSTAAGEGDAGENLDEVRVLFIWKSRQGCTFFVRVRWYLVADALVTGVLSAADIWCGMQNVRICSTKRRLRQSRSISTLCE